MHALLVRTCTVVGSRILIIFIVLIMIFIIMVNGNGRPPACKMQEARTGNYIPIWSGLSFEGYSPGLISRTVCLRR